MSVPPPIPPKGQARKLALFVNAATVVCDLFCKQKRRELLHAGNIAALLVAIIYSISPIDIIPDVILGIGQVDDCGVWLGLLNYMNAHRHVPPFPPIPK